MAWREIGAAVIGFFSCLVGSRQAQMDQLGTSHSVLNQEWKAFAEELRQEFQELKLESEECRKQRLIDHQTILKLMQQNAAMQIEINRLERELADLRIQLAIVRSDSGHFPALPGPIQE